MLFLAWLAVAVAAVEFALRALIRVNRLHLTDFAYPYISTRLWLAGANPYDPRLFYTTWYGSGATESGLPDALLEGHSVYPPMSLVPMVPFGLLRWPDAVHLFLACALALYAASTWGLLRLGWPGLSWRDLARRPAAVFFVAFALGLAPIHTAFNSENIVLLAIGAAILSICLLLRSATASNLQNVAAGAAMTLSLCLKPTTGIFLFPWLVRERRWRLIAGIIVACGIITAVSLGPLIAHQGLGWVSDYRSNVAKLFAHGGNADVSHDNYVNTDRIDLQLVLFAISGDRSASSLIALLVYAAIVYAFLKPTFKKYDGFALGSDMALLVAAGSLTLGMLPVYSRVYSAGVLLPLALWCLVHLHLRSTRWLLVMLCGFLVNSGAIVRRFFQSSAFATQSPRLWDATIGGHTCWLVLAIGLVLVWAMREQASEAGWSSLPASSAGSAARPYVSGELLVRLRGNASRVRR